MFSMEIPEMTVTKALAKKNLSTHLELIQQIFEIGRNNINKS